MRHVIVTGAAGILGRAVAAALDAQGCKVTGVDYASEPADFPGTFFGYVDLTSAAESGAAIAMAVAETPVNGLVNVVGGFRWETIADGSPQSWEFLYKLNVMTILHASRAALAPLRETRGAIVNVGAAATLKAGMGMGAYTASKSGVARLTEALAEEQKGAVRVNAVLPSIIDTPANRKDLGESDAGSWVTPNELAQVILFLLSESASAVTGASIPVTGRT